VPDQYEVATLSGFDIRIQPLANFMRSDQQCVYGIVATASHAGLGRLYQHAEHVLGGVYLPESVDVPQGIKQHVVLRSVVAATQLLYRKAGFVRPWVS
jgi:hypothetical protein